MSDIPDVVSRIFRLKLKEILDMLIKKEILGKVTAHMYTIEFQKRGKDYFFKKTLLFENLIYF